ncbi:MAG: hypothetical protein ABIC40_00755 [bacterium]
MQKTLISSILALALIITFGLACAPKSTDKESAKQSPSDKPAENGEKTSPVTNNSESPSETSLPVTEIPPVQGDTSPTQGRTFTGMVPPDWPEDVPIMEGLEIASGIINPPPENVMEVFCFGQLKLEDVWEFYSKLPGWEKDPSKQGKESGDLREINLVKGNESLFVGIMIDLSGAIQMNLRYRVASNAPEKTK